MARSACRLGLRFAKTNFRLDWLKAYPFSVEVTEPPRFRAWVVEPPFLGQKEQIFATALKNRHRLPACRQPVIWDWIDHCPT